MSEKKKNSNSPAKANNVLFKLDGITKQKKHGLKLKKILLQLVSFLIIIGILIMADFSINLYQKIDALKFLKKGKFLILLQNNAELRPTGGFIGSFAVLETQNYKPQKINFNSNIYKIDDEFTKLNTILPPKPLEKITKGKWAMRDANFAVDFAESAKQVQWFYNQETGDSVDGVVALNASLIKDLLKLTGPIELPQYETTISTDNFFDTLAFKIEKEYFFNQENWQEDEPKSILKDMMPILMEKALKISKLKLIVFFTKQFNEKQILLMSNIDDQELKIARAGWGGLVLDSTGDYLYINNANITDTSQNKNMGAKTSLKINQSVELEITKNEAVRENNLKITRTHTGTYNWPDGVNYNYMRVIVPKNSTLKQIFIDKKDMTSQVEIGEEAGKTYFALWAETAPQQTTIVNLTYSLPQNIKNNLVIQKQPGTIGDNFKIKINDKPVFSGLVDSDRNLF